MFKQITFEQHFITFEQRIVASARLASSHWLR